MDKITKILSGIFILLVLFQSITYETTYTIKTSFSPANNQSTFSSLNYLGFGQLLENDNISVIDLVFSNEILTAALDLSWEDQENNTKNLYDYYKINQPEKDEKNIYNKFLLLESLRKDLNINTNRRTNLITLHIDTAERNFGFDLLTLIQKETISKYNKIQNKQTSKKTEYISNRATQVKKELTKAEEEIQNFLENNRLINSPQLSIELKRLERNLEVQNQIYLTLIKESEISKAEELNSMPNILIIDEPYIDNISSFISMILKYILIYIILILSISIFRSKNIFSSFIER